METSTELRELTLSMYKLLEKDLLYGVKGKFEIKSNPTSESHKVVDRAE